MAGSSSETPGGAPAAEPVTLELTVYVSDNSPGSNRVLHILREFCRDHGDVDCRLEIVDTGREPERILADSVLVTPTVIRRRPLPEIRIIGDLSDGEDVTRLIPGEEW